MAEKIDGGSGNCGNPKYASEVADRSRTARAHEYYPGGGKPPQGPRAEPVRVNGVPMFKQSGVSKK